MFNLVRVGKEAPDGLSRQVAQDDVGLLGHIYIVPVDAGVTQQFLNSYLFPQRRAVGMEKDEVTVLRPLVFSNVSAEIQFFLSLAPALGHLPLLFARLLFAPGPRTRHNNSDLWPCSIQ